MDNKTKSSYLSAIIKILHQNLLDNKSSKEYEYLLSRVSEDKFDLFQFGLFPQLHSDIVDFIDDFGKAINDDPQPILQELNLIYTTKVYKKIHCFLKDHRILIPFYDVYGNPVSIVGRTLLSNEEQKQSDISKYKHLPFNKRNHIYGLNFSYKNIIEKDKVVVVEGQFDFISGYLNGIDNICCVAGSKFTFEHIALLKRFTNNFSVLLDNDEAGNAGWEKIKKNSKKYKINVDRIVLPNIKLVDNCKDLFDFLQIGSISDLNI